MPTICYFEIPADDIEKIKKFYADLFEWKIEKHKRAADYWTITTTTSSGEKGISGGIEKRQAPQHRITVHIDVPSVDEYSARIEKLGGLVFVPKTAISGEGYYAVCQDPEKNYFYIWETNKNAQ
jgi:predicted enzyme related to lactoylglutathione lyase